MSKQRLVVRLVSAPQPPATKLRITQGPRPTDAKRSFDFASPPTATTSKFTDRGERQLRLKSATNMENAAMSGTTNSIELLKSFAEAGAALEQLPKVQADLEAAHSLIDETNAKLHSEQDNSARLFAEVAAVRAELAQREADLAQAMFRHNEAQKVIDSIRGALPSVAAGPDHGSEPSVTNSAPATTRGQDQGQGQNDAGPTPTDTPIESQTSAPGHTASTSGNQTEATPSQPNPGEATHNTPTNPSDGQSQSTERTGPTQAESSANTSVGPSAGDEPRPARQYEGSGYWAKPADMTWNDFASFGGLVPSWVVNWDQA